jgi:shikimate kinase/3-dehydroquinate synthase
MTGGRNPNPNPVLVFIGFMGAGKTTGARAAAAALGVRAVDTDRALEERLGSSIDDYFASHGERAFREAEEDLVAEFLEDPPAPVLSLGGGSIGSSRVRELLARHTVVLLHVDEPTAWRRAGGKRRPLARDRERFAALHAERSPVYESLADAILLDGGADTVRAASGALRAIPPGVKVLWAIAGDAQYPVYVGDVLDGEFWPVRGRRFVISDETVAAVHGGRLPAAEAQLAMPPGEAAKTLANAERLLRALAEAGMDHDDHVVALGGGVVGDVAGFCAAVYQRGVGVVQVPTTLVAQVDSAYGGKTGVDLPEGKNYVGAYHQPRAVLADPRTLASLPAAELAAGWAEVIKTALIAGGGLWERVRRGRPAVDRDLILACARTKLAVVASDERDAGRRQALNLGHTVGHAIETVTGYRRYRHGEAVGLGLLAALTLSSQPALRSEVADLLAERELPVTLDRDVDHDAVIAAVQRDKKRRGGRVGFVLVEVPGDVRTGAPVAESDIRAALAELR